MTSPESTPAPCASENRVRTVTATFSPAELQATGMAHEEAARSVMHPDYHDPDWRYYHGAMARAG